MNDAQATAPYGYCECGCGEPVSKGSRFRRGHWARVRPKTEPAVLFWSKVDKTPGHGPWGDCWLWTASTNDQGYGIFWARAQRRMVQAHRWAYEAEIGPLPPKPPRTFGAVAEVVRHDCDNPPCVNPAHLLAGTQQDNMSDMKARRRRPSSHGARNPRAKLTEAQVREARESYTGAYGQIAALARKYNLSHSAMSYVLHGQSWTT